MTSLVTPFVARYPQRRRWYTHQQLQSFGPPSFLLYSRSDIDDLCDELDALDEDESADLLGHFNRRLAEVQFNIQAGKTVRRALASPSRSDITVAQCRRQSVAADPTPQHDLQGRGAKADSPADQA